MLVSAHYTHTKDAAQVRAFSDVPAASHTRRPAFLPALGHVAAEFYSLRADADGQTADTIAIMRRFAQESTQNPTVLAAAAAAVHGLGTDRRAPVVAAACWRYVRTSCRFAFDEDKAPVLDRIAGDAVHEVLLRPADMLRWRCGDCDDFSTLLAALLTCWRIPNAFVTVAGDAAAPREFSHVYNVAYVPVRLALDASHGQMPGWETEQNFRRQEWPVWGVA